MSARAQAFLWIGQRASAAILSLCVLVHLCTIILAVRGGLSAAEILARTKGNLAWFAFYSGFVLAVAVHVPIGLRAIFAEWLGWRDPSRDYVLWGLAAALAALGMRAVIGVFGA